ncbi:MAG: GNAT family N-acetyltransferase [Limnothrix sp. RL_2_0]|nr:GNAT family N-acetyltransferase [Limnothrix sp. RL_2_0]
MGIVVTVADYRDQKQGQDIVFLLDYYASTPSGGGQGLAPSVKENVVRELSKLPYAFSLLCYVDDSPAGLLNCFHGFSTFQCRPLLNIHDAVVYHKYRRQGISQLLLGEAERIARAKGACKITLEVLEKNQPAVSAYKKFGFAGYELDPEFGKALFLEKALT